MHHSERGIALATDSRAVTLPDDAQRDTEALSIRKLFQLTSHIAMVTGGAGYGVLLCDEFQRHIREEGIVHFRDVVERALPFFRSERTVFQQRNVFAPNRPDLDRLYFLIAGYDPRESESPFQSALFASEDRADPLHRLRTGRVVAIPRQLGLEYRLSRLDLNEATLDEAESIFREFLEKLARTGSDVGPPFYFVRITPAGVTVREDPGEGLGKA